MTNIGQDFLAADTSVCKTGGDFIKFSVNVQEAFW
jgi:hypothetical protein